MLADATRGPHPRVLRLRAAILLAYFGMMTFSEVCSLGVERRRVTPHGIAFDLVGYRRRTIFLDRAHDPDLCPVLALQQRLAFTKADAARPSQD